MKKAILTLITIHLSLFTLFAQSGGNGTAGNPYQIKNCDDLQAMELHKTSYWIMMNDVDCSATKTGSGQWGSKGFRPIGDTGLPFEGNFNGNCYSVANLFINNPSQNFAGLFGFADSAYIKDIEILNSEVIGGDHTGMVIGFKKSTYFDDGFTTGKVSGGNYTGGVVGLSDNYQGTYSELTNCSSEATVKGNNFTGGIIGKITTYQGGASYLINCQSTGNVTGNNSTGGIAGNAGTYQGGGAELQYCYSTGTVSGHDSTGGLAGSIGPVMGGGSYIIESYFVGSVTGHNDVGGLAGYNGPNSGGASTINNSYNQGNVNGNTNVGGVVGYQVSTGPGWGVDTNYSTGVITGTTNVGGLVGNQSNGSVFNTNYWDSVVNSPTLKSVGNLGNIAGIKPEGTVQMQLQATYLNWNFVSIWNMPVGNFPALNPSPANGPCNFPNTMAAAFDMTPDSTCSGDTVFFYDRSTNSPTGWSWNFGDPASGPNNTSTLQNPVHRFSVIGWYTVKEVVTKGANKDSIMSPIHIYCGVTDVNQLSQMQGVKIYPNPSNGKFTIQSSVNSSRLLVNIYNVLGEQVYSSILPQTPKGASTLIDISNQPAGVYMYRIVDEKGALVDNGKLIIQ